MGNGYTTYREIQKAPYREENFEKMAEMAPQIPFMSDKELKEHSKEIDDLYEYRKGTDKIRDAFRILVPKPPAKITTFIFNLFPPRVYLCSPSFVGGYIVTGP